MSRWGNLFGLRKPEKFSLENLKYLHETLSRNAVITEKNKNLVIESLRQMSEVLIWGDQNNVPQIFDYFLEKHMLAHFLNILSQKTGQQVKVQLLQTLSILITGIKSETHLYYMLSNNHINELITHRFDFSNEEVLAYYISFLKSLSLKLNDNTLQFFFNDAENDFPLYTEAVKFFNHSDNMVRTAVRNLTLNVYKVENERMRTFILDRTTAPYFSNIVWFIAEKCRTLDRLVTRSSSHTGSRRELAAGVDELLDVFYYINDIFHLKMASMNKVLASHLLENLLLPLFRGSLVGRTGGASQERLSPGLALFLLAQVFHIFSHKRLIDTLGAALIHPNPTTYIHQMLKQTDSTKDLISLGSGGSSNGYMVKISDMRDNAPSHSSLPSYDSGSQPTRVAHGNSASKFHKRSFSVPTFVGFEEANSGTPAAQTPGPTPNKPAAPMTPVAKLVAAEDKKISGSRRLFGRREATVAVDASTPGGGAQSSPISAASPQGKDQAPKQAATGKRDASPTKVGLFASLLRKKEQPQQDKTTNEQQQDEESERSEDKTDGDVKESGDFETEGGSATDEAQEPLREESDPFPGIPLATESPDDFTKKQHSGEHDKTSAGDAAEQPPQVDEATSEALKVDDNAEDAPPSTEAEQAAPAGVGLTERQERRSRVRQRRLPARGRSHAAAVSTTALPGIPGAGKPHSRRDPPGAAAAAAGAAKAERNKYRDAILRILEEGEDNAVMGALALLYALLRNASIDKPILQVSGLYPLRMSKAKQLLDALTATSPLRDDKDQGVDRLAEIVSSAADKPAGKLDHRLFASMSPPHQQQLLLVEQLKAAESKSTKTTKLGVVEPDVQGHDDSGEPIEHDSNNSSREDNAVDDHANDDDDDHEDGDDEGGDEEEEDENEGEEEEESGDFGESSPSSSSSSASSSSTSDIEDLAAAAPTSDAGNPKSRQKANKKKTTTATAATTKSNSSQPQSWHDADAADKEEADRLQHEKRNNRPRKTDLLQQHQQQQQQEQQQRLPSSQDWTEKILSILTKSHAYRLITVQLAAILLKELVYCPDTDSNLTPAHVALLLEAYNGSVEKVKQRLNGSLGGIFLQLFEEEMSKYRQLNFEDLVTDPSSLLPVSATPYSDLPLSKRLPNGELEQTRRAILGFFVLRDLKYTLLRKKDFRLPLKERGHRKLKYSTKNLKVGAGYPITEKERARCVKGLKDREDKSGGSSSNSGGGGSGSGSGAGGSGTPIRWLVLPVDLQLAILHPADGPADPVPVIRHLVPLQNVELQVDKLDPRKLVIGAPASRGGGYGLVLRSADECLQVKARLEKERNKLRDYKLTQIMKLFADTGDEREGEEEEEEEEDDDDEEEEEEEEAEAEVEQEKEQEESHDEDGDDDQHKKLEQDKKEQQQHQPPPTEEDDDPQSDVSEASSASSSYSKLADVTKAKEDVRDEDADEQSKPSSSSTTDSSLATTTAPPLSSSPPPSSSS